MSKKDYLVILIVCVIASLSSLSSLIYGILERGFSGVNYGLLIPVAIGIWSFIKWRRKQS